MINDHWLGDCEKDEGFLCEECRQEYMDRADDMALSKDDDGWEGEY